MNFRHWLGVAAILSGAFVSSASAGESSKAELEGQLLCAELLAQRPSENFTQTGVLKIRKGRPKAVEIPIRIETVVSGTNWRSTYEVIPNAANTNAVRLTILHAPCQPTEYLLAEGVGTNPDGAAPKRLTADKIMVPFAGSDFWVADLGLEFFLWPAQKVLKHEMRRSRPCKVLESTNPAPVTNGYSRVVSWIDNETDGIVQAEAYDQGNKLLKEFRPKDFKQVNGRWELREMRINNLKTGSQTTIEFDLKAN